MTHRCSSAAALLACASCALGGSNPMPPGGHWANEHLGNWRPERPDYGLEFATVTHAGNRGANASERFDPGISQKFWPTLGSVDHEYRISTTEVSANQWLPFFLAFLPRYVESGGSALDGRLGSEHLTFAGMPVWGVKPGEGRSAVRVGWEFAARYCNWLHNGAPTGPDVPLEVFQSGAYDMPALTGPNFDPNQLPLTHSEGAKYWLPSVDEWVKAAHYDPDRYGDGQEGYWLRMGQQDEPLTPGLPWEGGQTSAGPGIDTSMIPVGAYGDVVSPWGLYDTSGGETEWTGDIGVNYFFGGDIVAENRYVLGTGLYSTSSFFSDPTDGLLVQLFAGANIGGTPAGFRIASLVPSPCAAGVLLAGVTMTVRRRRDS